MGNWLSKRISRVDLLHEGILEIIFSYSGSYNFVQRQVCSDFRRIMPEVDRLAYLDALLADGFVPKKLERSYKLFYLALDRGYLNIFLYHGGYVLPTDFCHVCARKGHLHMLQWAHEKGFLIIKSVYREAIKAEQRHVAQWLIDNNLS